MNGKENGFTLLELLIVVTIIGLLATLAMANYSVFKIHAYNATAASDTRGLATAAEYASDPLRFTGPTPYPLTGTGGLIAGLSGGSYSPGTYGTVDIVAPNQYVVMASHERGDLCYTIDSSDGGVMAVSNGPCS
ncbi:MAG: type IV pilin protein [Candidatus Binatia bacterium]